MISEIKAASLFSSTILTEYYSGEDPRHGPCSDRERDHSSPVEKVPPHFFVIFKKRQDPVSTMQKTSLTNFSSFLVWSGKSVDVITMGHSRTIFLCIELYLAW